MSRKDITDRQVVEACKAYHDDLRAKVLHHAGTSIERLRDMTGEPEKVCRAAIERAYDRGLVEIGMGPDWAWPTDEGMALLEHGAQP